MIRNFHGIYSMIRNFFLPEINAKSCFKSEYEFRMRLIHMTWIVAILL